MPGGFFVNANDDFPADFKPLPGPAGVTFSGRAFSEPQLIGLAYAFEQATRYRVSPPTTPALPSDAVTRYLCQSLPRAGSDHPARIDANAGVRSKN